MLAADEWGVDDTTVKDVFGPLEDWFLDAVPSLNNRYPQTWKPATHIGRLVRNILLSEELVHEYAEYFDGLSTQELDDLARSFAFGESSNPLIMLVAGLTRCPTYCRELPAAFRTQ